MNSRRDFLNMAAKAVPATVFGSLFLQAGCNTSQEIVLETSDLLSRLPQNIIYTKTMQGQWQGKAGSHLPMVTTKEDGSLHMETKHGMSEKHFIVRHSLVSLKGEALFSKTYYPSEEKAATDIEAGKIKGHKSIIAFSFCNLHDLWMAEISLAS